MLRTAYHAHPKRTAMSEITNDTLISPPECTCARVKRMCVDIKMPLSPTSDYCLCSVLYVVATPPHTYIHDIDYRRYLQPATWAMIGERPVRLSAVPDHQVTCSQLQPLSKFLHWIVCRHVDCIWHILCATTPTKVQERSPATHHSAVRANMYVTTTHQSKPL